MDAGVPAALCAITPTGAAEPAASPYRVVAIFDSRGAAPGRIAGTPGVATRTGLRAGAPAALAERTLDASRGWTRRTNASRGRATSAPIVIARRRPTVAAGDQAPT
jgi:hypothetical protein